MFFVLTAVLVADVLSVPAAAFTTQTWNTTALFNAGTKASTMTVADAPCRLQSNQVGLYFYGAVSVNATCPTGSNFLQPTVANLTLAYDDSTWTASNNLKDFANSVGTTSNKIANVTGLLGQGIWIGTNTKSYLKTNVVANWVNTVFWQITAGSWVYLNVSDGNVKTIFNTLAQSGNGFVWDYILGGNAVIQYGTGTTNGILTFGPLNYAVGWHFFVFQANYVNGTARVCEDSLCFQSQSMTGTHPKPSSAFPDFIYMGSYQGTSSPLTMTIDNMIILNSWASASQLQNWSTSPLIYRPSGYWKSPVTSFGGSLVPGIVNLTFKNITSHGWLSAVSILDGTGNVLWSYDLTQVTGTTIQLSISPPQNIKLTSSWAVKISLTGDTMNTAILESVTVSATQAIPLFQSSDVLFLFGLVLLALAVFGLFPEGPEFPLITIVSGLLFVLWTFLFLSPTLGGGVYLVMGLGIGALFTVLGIGRFLAEATT